MTASQEAQTLRYVCYFNPNTFEGDGGYRMSTTSKNGDWVTKASCKLDKPGSKAQTPKKMAGFNSLTRRKVTGLQASLNSDER